MGMLLFLPVYRNENDTLKKCFQSKNLFFKVLKTVSVLAYGDEYFIKFPQNVHCETILDKIMHFIHIIGCLKQLLELKVAQLLGGLLELEGFSLCISLKQSYPF